MFEKERHTVPNTQLNATWTHLKLFFSALCRRWVWTEWSSCQVLCDIHGEEPVGPRENKTSSREKFFPDDSHNICQGGREVKQCDEKCQSKISHTTLYL